MIFVFFFLTVHLHCTHDSWRTQDGFEDSPGHFPRKEAGARTFDVLQDSSDDGIIHHSQEAAGPSTFDDLPEMEGNFYISPPEEYLRDPEQSEAIERKSGASSSGVHFFKPELRNVNEVFYSETSTDQPEREPFEDIEENQAVDNKSERETGHRLLKNQHKRSRKPKFTKPEVTKGLKIRGQYIYEKVGNQLLSMECVFIILITKQRSINFNFLSEEDRLKTFRKMRTVGTSLECASVCWCLQANEEDTHYLQKRCVEHVLDARIMCRELLPYMRESKCRNVEFARSDIFKVLNNV